MRYFKARWLHDGKNDNPVLLYSELDEARWETRKVYIFADGRMEGASQAFETGDTGLGLVPIPPLEEINSQDEFEAVDITQDEFETVWRQAIARRNASRL